MKAKVIRHLIAAYEEEESVEPSVLLDLLRAFSSQDTKYLGVSPEDRAALNAWFTEVKDLFLQEILQGRFGAQVLLDAFFVLCFEVGYKTGVSDTAPELLEAEEGES